MPVSSAELLTVRNLSVGYSRREDVLHDISLSINEGECVGILGHNGAGKTTLVRAIAGHIPPREGEIRLDGQSLRTVSSPKRVSRGIVLVPQGRALFAKMSIEENVKLGAYRKSGQQATAAWEEQVAELPWFADRRRELVGLLSGGQQQLVANARGIASQPKLLMVDEPSVGLSGLAVSELSQRLLRMRDGGQTTILVEQNLGLALAVCDRFLVLREGKLVGNYTKDELPMDGLWSLF